MARVKVFLKEKGSGEHLDESCTGTEGIGNIVSVGQDQRKENGEGTHETHSNVAEALRGYARR